MSRVWLLLIPTFSPVVLLLSMYLIAVVPKMGRQNFYTSGTFLDRLLWSSRYWWNEVIGRTEYALAICGLAFLAGSIAALLLHLRLPRPARPGHHDDAA